jgi:hypothetical protein
MSTGDPIARPDALGVAALGAIAFAPCDSLRELGHPLAAALPGANTETTSVEGRISSSIHRSFDHDERIEWVRKYLA